jgi:hypothetical protein
MKRCYESGASKRKRHAHAKNELSKQNNSLDAFVSRKHVHDDEEKTNFDQQIDIFARLKCRKKAL